MCNIVKNILQAIALIIQVLQDHITPIVQGSFWVRQQSEKGFIHLKSLTCLRVAQPQFLQMDRWKSNC